jgi:hypothetical protein
MTKEDMYFLTSQNFLQRAEMLYSSEFLFFVAHDPEIFFLVGDKFLHMDNNNLKVRNMT